MIKPSLFQNTSPAETPPPRVRYNNRENVIRTNYHNTLDKSYSSSKKAYQTAHPSTNIVLKKSFGDRENKDDNF